MGLNGQFPLIAILAGGAIVMSVIILYQLWGGEGSRPDPIRERSPEQDSYMRDVRTRSKQRLWDTRNDDVGRGSSVSRN